MRKIGKFLLGLFIISLILFVCILPAFAADSSPGDTLPGTDETGYTTWDMLATTGGAVLVTLFIVNFLKLPFDKIWKIPTRFVVCFIALLLLVLYEIFTSGTITWERAPLILINAAVVATSAMKTYELASTKTPKPG